MKKCLIYDVRISAVLVLTILCLGCKEDDREQPPAAGEMLAFYDMDITPDGGCFALSHIRGTGELWRLNSDGDTMWTQPYDLYLLQDAYALATYRDGGCVVTGRCFADADSGDDMFVARHGVDGTRLWERRIFGSSFHGEGIATMSNGDVVAVGIGILDTLNYAHHFVTRLNGDGEILWIHEFAGQRSSASDVVELSDNRVAVIGWWPDVSSLAVYADSGHLETLRYLEGSGRGAKAVALATNGTLIVTSFTENSGDDDVNICTANFTTEGNLIWQRLDGGLGWDSANDCAETQDGGSVVVGQYGLAAEYRTLTYVIRLSASGDSLWTYRSSYNGSDDAVAVSALPDGGFAVLCNSWDYTVYQGERYPVNYRGYLLRLNTDGDSLWAKGF